MTTLPGLDGAREIVRTDRFVLYRAERTADRRRVLLKLPLADAEAARAEAERDLLLALRGVAGAPEPLDVLRVASRAALVLADPGGESLATLLRRRQLDVEGSLAAGSALAALLSELHAREVVFRGLAPHAIVVRQGDGGAAPPAAFAVDLALAARGPLEAAASLGPLDLRSILPWASPEETGRMNRTPDHRSDLYSLGVILYEALAGRLPFDSDDPLEIVHGHIAKTPVPPCDAAPTVPRAVSDIVLKLLAKAPEERYQSALGAKSDLDRALARLREDGRVAPFPLGENDFSGRSLAPKHLYGRERDIAAIEAAWERASAGESAFFLVSGYSGIGKTSLIRSLEEPVRRRGGRLVSGKFDQVVRDVPYGALIRAFHALVRRMLAEPEESVTAWRERLSAALGGNGGVLAEVIPELSLLIGPQPEPARLGPIESMNRFRLVLHGFVAALASPERPLAVFLDDLQWADPATLDLLTPLLASPDCRGLFLVGAYRDNEVDAGHPLARTIARLRESGVALRETALGPLGPSDLERLVADAIRADPATAAPLAALVMTKTAGNPFFVIQFLNALRQKRLLEFDHASGRFSFDLEKIAAAGMTDNVIDLMTAKIRELPPLCARALTVAACVGNEFDVETIGEVGGLGAPAAALALEPALAAGLVLPARSDGRTGAAAYEFLHDRVQQAAYALVPEVERARLHLAIGRRLSSTPDADAEKNLFDVVQQLDLGRSLITDESEKVALARRNLDAARKAKRSAAFAPARGYAEIGRSLLEDRHFESDYVLAYELHLENAECAYLSGRFEEANGLFEALLARARSPLDRARVREKRAVLLENESRYAEAVSEALEALALLGVVFPRDAGAVGAALERELEAIAITLGEKPIPSLVDLPPLEKPEIRAIIRILTTAWSSTYITGQQPLTRLMSATIVRLSLQNGNCEESAYGYVTHAITVGSELGDYARAYEWGLLALAVNEKLRDAKSRAKVHHQFAVHVNVWRRPLATSKPHAAIATRSGLETGDLTYAGYGIFCETWNAFLTTRSLERFARASREDEAAIRRLKMESLADAQALLTQWAEALRGLTASPLSLTGVGFDEALFEERHGGVPFYAAFLHGVRAHLAIVRGEPRLAMALSTRARQAASALHGTIWSPLLDFLHALALAGATGGAPEEERAAAAGEIDSIREYLDALAASCPENFLGWALLVHAESARLALRDPEAMTFYEEAIRHARETGLLADEALANLLCARYWLSRENGTVAGAYVREARRLYAELGADGVLRTIDERHGAALPGAGPAGGAAPAGTAASLDAATVAKAAHAIAAETETGGLLRRLMRIAIENAGADRGAFVREKDGRAVVVAEGSVDPDRFAVIAPPVPLGNCDRIAHGVVQYVRKTGESVVIGNARADERFSSDPRFAAGAVRSVLCVPARQKGRLAGVLYLENGLLEDAFPLARVEMTELLSTHAAIALENARLYEGMREEVERRRRAEEDLRTALGEVETLKNRLEAENVYLQEEIRREHRFDEMVGSSEALLDVLRRIERVAPTDSTVLVVGETGTGKELVARAVHDRSARKGRPLVKVNCGAISAGLVESELFGHVRGAFTGALENRTGRFELADGGTLFLDEVGELPLETQVKLLRVLQEGEFEPVGSSRTVKVDVRIIAATNRDLDAAVREGRFRADLFYRLNVLPLRVPPLRERRTDVPPLALYFVERFSKRFGKRFDGIARESMERLTAYPWPGNVRELQNVIERAVALSSGPVLRVESELEPAAGAPKAPVPPPAEGVVPAAARASVGSLDDAERRHILAALRETDFVIEGPRGAALILNLHPNTLRSRMKKLGIRRPAPPASSHEGS